MRNWYAFSTVSAALVFVTACADTPTSVTSSRRAPAPAAARITGAAFTTVDATALGCFNGTGEINCNLYSGKDKVYLSGGPIAAAFGVGGLGGRFVFTVLVPGYQNPGVEADGTPGNLSDLLPSVDQKNSGDLNDGLGDPRACRVFDIDASGNIDRTPAGACAHALGTSLGAMPKALLQLMPYDNTTNNGGGYILAVCQLNAAGAPADCKYDYFKIRDSECTENCEELGNPDLAGLKYYDANRNGRFDLGEAGIAGWRIDITGGVLTTDGSGEFFTTVTPGNYHLAERQPNAVTSSIGWVQTGNTVDQIDEYLNLTTLTNKQYDVQAVLAGSTTGLNFGNVCRVVPGGKTMGFWSNNNGRNAFNGTTNGTAGSRTGTSLALVNGLPPVNGAGTVQSFANHTAYKNWLLSANANNMAYMLSAQLSATALNVQWGYADGTAPVDFSVTPARSVTQLIAYARTLLANPVAGYVPPNANGRLTIKTSALRTEQERVKNILDTVNNSGEGTGVAFWLTWVQAQTYCPISFTTPT